MEPANSIAAIHDTVFGITEECKLMYERFQRLATANRNTADVVLRFWSDTVDSMDKSMEEVLHEQKKFVESHMNAFLLSNPDKEDVKQELESMLRRKYEIEQQGIRTQISQQFNRASALLKNLFSKVFPLWESKLRDFENAIYLDNDGVADVSREEYQTALLGLWDDLSFRHFIMDICDTDNEKTFGLFVLSYMVWISSMRKWDVSVTQKLTLLFEQKPDSLNDVLECVDVNHSTVFIAWSAVLSDLRAEKSTIHQSETRRKKKMQGILIRT